MKKSTVALVNIGTSLAVASALVTSAGAVPTVGDTQRAVLISWDGVRRDVLHELLRKTDPTTPCWNGGTVFPVATGGTDTAGNPLYTCLPALAGVQPAGAPVESPAYGPFQVIASHTTDDGQTMTKPQHAAMLSGFNTETIGITGNVSITRMPVGYTVYERLMDAFDPVASDGSRNGFLFRTQHSADKKFVGATIIYWAKRSRAVQIATGHGNDSGDNPGVLKYAQKTFERWRLETEARGLPEPSFLLFLHFKATDWAGHLSGDASKQYRQTIVEADRKLYTLMEMLRQYGWDDAAILVTTDHGFEGNQHGRNGGRHVFNTWIAARNVQLHTDHIPTRTAADYCASHSDPAACTAAGEPMPVEDAVPNVYVTSIVPTLLDMFGVEWRATTTIEGVSLYQP